MKESDHTEAGRKQALLEYLAAHPGNISGAAKTLGYPRQEVERLLEKYPHEFRLLQDEYLDKLQEAVLCSALGNPLPEGINPMKFKPLDAVRILALYRPEWNKSGKKEKARKPWQQNYGSNGYAGTRVPQLSPETFVGGNNPAAATRPKAVFCLPANVLFTSKRGTEPTDGVEPVNAVDAGEQSGGGDNASGAIIDIPD